MFEDLVKNTMAQGASEGTNEEPDYSNQMFIIQKELNESGGYGPLQTWEYEECPESCWFCPGTFFKTFYPDGKRMAGFVTYTVNEETKTVVSMEWNEEAYQKEVAKLPDPVVEAKKNKKVELSNICSSKINEGMDIELSTGKTEHFTYDINDQANISEMFMALIAGATEYPYHATGESCIMFSAKDIVAVYSSLTMLKTGQITYQNQLKQYVNTLTTEEEINAVTYGQELTGTYLTEYNSLVAQAKTQLEAVLARIGNINPALA